MQAVREAKDYSADERRQFQEAFRSLAARYRRHRRIELVWLLIAGGCLFLEALVTDILDKPVFIWSGIPFFVCGAVWFFKFMTTPRLFCPGCSRDMEVPFGDYCPQCGCKGLEAQRG